jgi:predicted PurR-regulated permease PerM
MLAAFVIVIAGMRTAEPILNPLLLSIFLSVVSAPAYFGLLKRGFSQWMSLLIVIACLSALFFGMLYFVVGSITSFTARQDHYRGMIAERKQEIQRRVDQWLPDWAKPAATEESIDGDKPTAPDEPAGNDSTDADSPDADLADTTPNATDSDAPESPDADAAQTTTEDQSTDQDSELLVSASPDESDSGESATTLDDEATDQSDQDDQQPRDGPDHKADSSDHLQTGGEGEKKSWSKLIYSQFDPGTVISLSASLVTSLGNLLSNAFLILLTVVFILLEVSTFRAKLNQAFERNAETTHRAREIIQSIQKYIAIKTVLSLLTGVLITVWLVIFKVPYAGLWGLLAFLLNYIPNVGSIIAAIPAVLIAWLELSTFPAIGAAIGFVVINMVVGNFLEPRLMGRGLGLSALVVFCSMVFWGWVLGPIGMLLSVPLTMTVRIALEGFDDTKWIAILMSNIERD